MGNGNQVKSRVIAGIARNRRNRKGKFFRWADESDERNAGLSIPIPRDHGDHVRFRRF